MDGYPITRIETTANVPDLTRDRMAMMQELDRLLRKILKIMFLQRWGYC